MKQWLYAGHLRTLRRAGRGTCFCLSCGPLDRRHHNLQDLPSCWLSSVACWETSHCVSRQSISVHQATLPDTRLRLLETSLGYPAEAVDECSRQTPQRCTTAREAFEGACICRGAAVASRVGGTLALLTFLCSSTPTLKQLRRDMGQDSGFRAVPDGGR